MPCSAFSFSKFTIAPQVAYSIAYIVLAIALLTLNPFHFQTYTPAEWWVWRFWLSDVLQNILLFIPLGILLRQGLGLPYRLCLLWGFGFSFAIETTQLFIPARTSNVIDLLANSAGSLGGSGLCGLGFYKTKLERDHRYCSQLSLAVMLIPLCWVRAMVMEWQSSSAWVTLPSAIAILMLLQPIDRRFNKAQMITLLLALLPLANESLLICLLIVGASIFLYQLSQLWRLSSQSLMNVGILGLGCGLIIRHNHFWLRHKAVYVSEVWYKLNWIEIVLSFAVLLVHSWMLYRHSKQQEL